MGLTLSITNGIVSSIIYDKPDDVNFEIVNFPFLHRDVPRSPSYGVYISQLIRFARVCSNVDDFNTRNLFLTAKLLKQGYRYHKIRKEFSKFYHRHSELIVNLSSWCLVMVERLFLAVPRGCLQFVIVVFPDHTHFLFLSKASNHSALQEMLVPWISKKVPRPMRKCDKYYK